MTHQQTKHILHRPTPVAEVNNFWTEDFREELRPNYKNLFGRHKVPKFKTRFQA